MKKLLLLAFSVFLLNACVLTYQEPIFQESNTIQLPNVSGTYKMDDGKSFTFNPVKDTTNTFMVSTPSKKESIKVIFEPLESEGNYLTQIHKVDTNAVTLSIAQITNNTITFYMLNPKSEELAKLATKFNISFSVEEPLIELKSFESVNELKDFANLLLAPEFLKDLKEVELYK